MSLRYFAPATAVLIATVVACGADGPTVVVEDPGDPQSTALCTSPGAAWIWCDDFEEDRTGSYFEYDASNGSFARADGSGREGSTGMRAVWSPGQVGAGALHLAVGRTPDSYRRSVESSAVDHRSLYWRFYLKNEAGWTGGGGHKLTRAFIFHSPDNWGQAMAAHVWSGGQGNAFLTLDPASGTDAAGAVQTDSYNDVGDFRWLGALTGSTPIFSALGVGRWYCIEAHVALNDAGASNGVFRLWIDGNVEAEAIQLDWVGSYSAYGLNAVFLENYWDGGSPAGQARVFDDFVVSTQRIGC